MSNSESSQNNQDSKSRGLPSPERLLEEVIHHRGWSVREGQSTMVAAFAEEIDRDSEVGGISANGPVGIGKTLAYLLASLPTDQRIVVATSTKALQDQIVEVELPRLATDLNELYSFQLTYSVLKGKSNYLCMEASKALIQGRPIEDEALFSEASKELLGTDISHIQDMVTRTEQAMSEQDVHNLDCGDMMKSVPSTVRRGIQSSRKCGMRSQRWYEDGENDEKVPCSAQDILEDSTCAYRSAYARSMVSDVTVMNTSLLASELLKGKNPVITPLVPQQLLGTGIIIVDEAHHLVRILTESMRDRLDFHETSRLCSTYFRRIAKRRPNFDQTLVYQDMLDQVQSDMVDIIDSKKSMGKIRFELSKRIEQLASSVEQLLVGANKHTNDQDGIQLSKIDIKDIDRTINLINDEVIDHLHTISNLVVDRSEGGDYQEWVYDIKFSGGFEGEPLLVDLVPLDLSFFRNELAELSLKSNPYLESSDTVRTSDIKSRLILCSGTITREVGTTIGMDDGSFLGVPSPFHEQNARICIPDQNISNPRSPSWVKDAWHATYQSIQACGGRTLFLSTSYEKMETFASCALNDMPEYKVLHQNNGMTRANLIEEFAEHEHSVLFGTTSFWEGVDVPGGSCSLVVIDRIPFPNPNDPIFEARRKWVDKHDGNPFYRVDVDQASIMIAQGIGRLIRSEQDVGGVLLLDSRIQQQRYGDSILRLVPPGTPKTNSLEAFLEWLRWVNPDTRTTQEVPQPDPKTWQRLRRKRQRH